MTRLCDEILYKGSTQGMITMVDLGEGRAPLFELKVISP